MFCISDTVRDLQPDERSFCLPRVGPTSRLISARMLSAAATVDPAITRVLPAFPTLVLPNCIPVPTTETPLPTKTPAMFSRVTESS